MKRRPYDVGGGKRSRGIALASPFASETAAIAEVEPGLPGIAPAVVNVVAALHRPACPQLAPGES
jgi:hypothetical protein